MTVRTRRRRSTPFSGTPGNQNQNKAVGTFYVQFDGDLCAYHIPGARLRCASPEAISSSLTTVLVGSSSKEPSNSRSSRRRGCTDRLSVVTTTWSTSCTSWPLATSTSTASASSAVRLGPRCAKGGTPGQLEPCRYPGPRAHYEGWAMQRRVVLLAAIADLSPDQLALRPATDRFVESGNPPATWPALERIGSTMCSARATRPSVTCSGLRARRSPACPSSSPVGG